MNEQKGHSIRPTPEVRDCLRIVKALDFELAYLALLTHEGIKPLSRWEKPLSEHGVALLERMGLTVRQVQRTVQTGKTVTETIFSATPACVQVYEQRFAGQPIDKSADTVRLEGFLFGYPPCCIARYVEHPYAPNDLPDEVRTVLFHWACAGCRITPMLVPVYTAIHQIIQAC